MKELSNGIKQEPSPLLLGSGKGDRLSWIVRQEPSRCWRLPAPSSCGLPAAEPCQRAAGQPGSGAQAPREVAAGDARWLFPRAPTSRSVTPRLWVRLPPSSCGLRKLCPRLPGTETPMGDGRKLCPPQPAAGDVPLSPLTPAHQRGPASLASRPPRGNDLAGDNLFPMSFSPALEWKLALSLPALQAEDRRGGDGVSLLSRSTGTASRLPRDFLQLPGDTGATRPTRRAPGAG